MEVVRFQGRPFGGPTSRRNSIGHNENPKTYHLSSLAPHRSHNHAKILRGGEQKLIRARGVSPTRDRVRDDDFATRGDLKKEQERAKDHVQSVARTLEKRIMKVDSGPEGVKSGVEGPEFERYVRRKFSSLFGDYVGFGAYVLEESEQTMAADLAWKSGRLSREARKDALLSDLVAIGGYGKDSTLRLFVAEISITVEKKDVSRASQRAKLWGATYALDPEDALPFVVGRKVSSAVSEYAREEGVLVIIVND